MNNEVLKTIKERRSIRSYKSDVVPNELLNEVLEAGTYAPTGRGAQSPKIIAITNKKYRDEVSKLNAKVMGKDNFDPYYGAPVIILVLANPNANTYVEDGTCVLMNMMLAAKSVGLATCWIHREKEIFNSDDGKKLLKEWGIEEPLVGIGSLALGYAASEPVTAKRKDNYIVHIN